MTDVPSVPYAFRCPICQTDLTLRLNKEDFAPARRAVARVPEHPLTIAVVDGVSFAVDCPISKRDVYPHCDGRHVFKHHPKYPSPEQLLCWDPNCWKGSPR